MRTSYSYAILLISLVSGASALCDPETDRHCDGFNEKNVDSNFSGLLGTGITPVENPGGGVGVDPSGVNPNGSGGGGAGDGGGQSSRSGSRIGNGAVLAMSTGVGVLIVAAALLKRSKNEEDAEEVAETATGLDSDPPPDAAFSV